MKPLLIFVALCGFAVPQAAQDPQPKVIPSSATEIEIPQSGNPPIAGDPPMMVPTMRDKTYVTHTRELGCEKGYAMWYLANQEPYAATGWNTDMTSNKYFEMHAVCVKPSFIAQLRKAEQ